MSTYYLSVLDELRLNPRVWLVTGVAGFIGSNLLEALLNLNQHVIGLDNFATGSRHNLADIRSSVAPNLWANFQFIQGDVTQIEDCAAAVHNVDYVLHHAALGSVPRSIADPIATNRANIDGFLNMLTASRDARVQRFVYASSSSVYGNDTELPKREDKIGEVLSPYALTKRTNELYACVFAHIYDFKTIGLRYFNVFGKRQDPNGAYAAVIPRWIANLIRCQPCLINGDGETSRDFCYIANVIQANILAATVLDGLATHQIYNIAYGRRTTLLELYYLIRNGLVSCFPTLDNISALEPSSEAFRPGDVRHSLADITKARRLLNYNPTHSVEQGLSETLGWYVNLLTRQQTSLYV